MQHLTEEQLVAHYYRDADAHDHLRSCAECAAQYETIRRVLALVTEAPVPRKARRTAKKCGRGCAGDSARSAGRTDG